ncbi:MAG: ribbon-helix-helix protein, CopG family [Actinomycetes bacterium]
MSQKTTDTGLVRLNVNLNQETAAALKELAAKENISYTEAVRRAIAVFKFIEDEQAEGRKIQTMDANDRNKRELVLM